MVLRAAHAPFPASIPCLPAGPGPLPWGTVGVQAPWWAHPWWDLAPAPPWLRAPCPAGGALCTGIGWAAARRPTLRVPGAGPCERGLGRCPARRRPSARPSARAAKAARGPRRQKASCALAPRRHTLAAAAARRAAAAGPGGRQECGTGARAELPGMAQVVAAGGLRALVRRGGRSPRRRGHGRGAAEGRAPAAAAAGERAPRRPRRPRVGAGLPRAGAVGLRAGRGRLRPGPGAGRMPAPGRGEGCCGAGRAGGVRAAEPGSFGWARARVPPAPGPRQALPPPPPPGCVLSPAGSHRLAKPGARKERGIRREPGSREGTGSGAGRLLRGMEGPPAPRPAVTSWPPAAPPHRPCAGAGRKFAAATWARWQRSRGPHSPKPGCPGPWPLQVGPWAGAVSGRALLDFAPGCACGWGDFLVAAALGLAFRDRQEEKRLCSQAP